MGELKEILEFLKKGDVPKTWNEVIEHFKWNMKDPIDKAKSQRIFSIYFDQPRKYVKEIPKKVGKDRPSAFVPSAKGILYLEESKLSDIKRRHSQVMVAATIIIAFASIVTGFAAWQNYVIFSQTAIPNEIDLLVELDGKNRLNLGDLVDDNENNENLKICVTNRGRIEAESIKLEWISDWTPHHPKELGNLPGGKKSCEFLEVECYDCITIENNESKFNTGPRELIVRAKCSNCDDSVLEEFEVCIYAQDSDECEM